MKMALQFLFLLLGVSIQLSCVVGAVILALNGIGCWFWFLIVALLISVKVDLEW